MQPLLLLRAHTDLRLGLGHVARALALHEAWNALGGATSPVGLAPIWGCPQPDTSG